MSDQEPPSLRGLFRSYQAKLEATLGLAEQIKHPTSKGDVAELGWLSMLRDYLPNRYQVTNGFVIDSNDRLSDQQDIIIFDRHFSPFILNHESFSYIPAESVYAIFEAKPQLTKDHLVYAGEKAESVRDLLRTTAPIVHAGGEIFKPKPPPPILAGILTAESSWNPALGEPFQKHILGLKGNQSLDLGCVASHGPFEVIEGSSGELGLSIGGPDTAVMSFVLTLIRRLQRLGSVPAIDIEKYAYHLA